MRRLFYILVVILILPTGLVFAGVDLQTVTSPYSTGSMKQNGFGFQSPYSAKTTNKVQESKEPGEKQISRPLSVSEEPGPPPPEEKLSVFEEYFQGKSKPKPEPEPEPIFSKLEEYLKWKSSSEKELSAFDEYIKREPTTIINKIMQFGYDLFENNPDTFTPEEIIPVGPGYLLGPGDELRINMWGKVNNEFSPIVDREGKIYLPMLGVLYLSGRTFSETKAFLEKEFSRYYKSSDVKINIGMGRLRSIRVFVVGKVKKPGSYILSSLSTLINALFAAGGPSKVGSMRDIQVKRNGKTIVAFDLYDFLLKGDKTKDVRLMPEDVVFIPTIGPLAGVVGNVKSPAIYELKEKTTLKELIKMSGGVRATGYLQRIQLERVFENKAKVIVDLNLQELPEKGNTILGDGDIVKIFPIIHEVTNSLELKGNIKRPGTYEWREGIKIKDILKSEDDLLPDTMLKYALISRLVPPDNHKEYVSFNLAKLFVEKDEKENVSLMPHDTIVVFNKWDLMEQDKVRITGAINKSGEYEYRPNMKLSDLLKLAGGLKKYAYSSEAELTRITPTPEGPVTKKIIVNLEKAFKRDPQHDILLEENDYLFVRAVPEWELYRQVTIEGEVRFPGTYTIQKGETISSLIERAGGFTDRVYLKGAVFVRKSVKELQQAQLKESIDRLEQQILSESAYKIATALSSEAAKQEKTSSDQRHALISKMRAAEAKGRVSIKLYTLDKFKGSPFDIALEEGDALMIPEKPAHVQVIGSVYNQNAFVYEKKANILSYIKKSGGMRKNAEEDELYVLKIDGTAISQRDTESFFGLQWDSEKRGWVSSNFMVLKLDPGDTIVVPEKIEKIAWLREIKDITQILFQIAVTTGVLLVAF